MDYSYFTPTNVIIKEGDHEIAKHLITDKTAIRIQYLREHPTVGLALMPTGEDSPPYKKRVICSGLPYGCMVAFLHDDALYIGWSKRCTAKDEDLEPLENKPFCKKGARHAAILRGLNDTISFTGKHIVSAYSGPIPARVRRSLRRFIVSAERKFERKAINVGYPELLPEAFEPTAKNMVAGMSAGAL